MYKKFDCIGILDHMGFGNFGDMAAQEAFITNVKRRLPNVKIIGFSLNPNDTRVRHNIPSYPITRNYPGTNSSEVHQPEADLRNAGLKSVIKRWGVAYKIAKAIHNCIFSFAHNYIGEGIKEAAHIKRSFEAVRSLDLLVISGGGQLCDIWNGPWSHPYNLFKFSVLARLSNTPLYILNGGAGPLVHPLSKFFGRWSVRLACYASFRDKQSQDYIRSLGVNKKTYVSPDMAFSLDLNKWAPDRERERNLQRPLVGLNPMSFCDPRVWPRKDSVVYRKYIEKLASFSLWILEQDFYLEIFTTAIGADRLAIEDLKGQLLHKLPEDIISKVFKPINNDFSDVIYQISNFDYVITPKFHGVIFSQLLNKPVIALKYSNKTFDLMSNVGHSQYCFDIEDFDVDCLKESFELLVKDRSTFKPLFSTAVEKYAHDVQNEFDELFGPQQ